MAESKIEVTAAKRFKIAAPPLGVGRRVYQVGEKLTVPPETAAYLAKHRLIDDRQGVLGKVADHVEAVRIEAMDDDDDGQQTEE